MGYDPRRFGVGIGGSTIAASAFVVLVLSSQLAMAILPVLGIGGFYIEADYFYGQDGGTIYPQKGSVDSTPDHGVTDTFECQERPMLVFELDDARIYGFTMYVDIELPFQDRWMSIQLEQPSAADFRDSAFIQGDNIKIYSTQFAADYLSLKNVVMTEDGDYTDFGPTNDQFIMKADPSDQTGSQEAIYSENLKMWLHAVTGSNIVFDKGAQTQSLSFELTYPTTDELDARYGNVVDYTGSEAAPDSPDSREDYFDCLPP